MSRFSICFLACVVAANCSAQAPALRPDAVEQRLLALKKDFLFECKMADDDLLFAIETSSTAAMLDGDLRRHTDLETEKKNFQSENLLPKHDDVSRAGIEHARRFQEAKTTYVSDVEAVVADCTRAGDTLRAAAVRDDLELWKQRLSRKKTPKTRYVPGVVPRDAVKWDENGHYYKVVHVKSDIGWQEAKKQCEEMGGRLACGETPEELAHLNSLSIHAWTGARRFEAGPHQGKWVWLTGVAVEESPRDSNGDAVFASTAPPGLMARREDGRRAKGVTHFICEWDDEVIW